MSKILPVLTVVGILLVGWLVWEWGFCRFYVPQNHMAILVSKTGKPLDPGQILAKKGQRGIQEEVLGEGRHFRNPFFYEWKILPMTIIPPGKIGIVTSKVGTDLPHGEFLADEGQKGIWRKVLGPGKHRINPQGYVIDMFDAIVVPIGYVGVITSLDGKAPAQGAFAEIGERGVRKDVLQPGLYYINPKQFKVDVVEIGINQISLIAESEKSHKQIASGQNIEFPSKDGFEIKMDTTVEIELLPQHIPSTFSKYGNLQAVVDKIILPQVLSISRLKGSAYGARDFIVGEGREQFQNDFTEELEETLQAKNIEIRSALIRHVTVPDQILKPIQDASIAQLRNLTNIEKQTTAKKLAELNTERSLIDQKTEQIQQETKKLKAEIKAVQDKEVAEINAGTQRSVAEIEKETALVRADTRRKLGKIEADVTQMIGEAKAEGFNLQVDAFKDSGAYSLFTFASQLPENLKIAIAHSGAGTLWTDLDRAMSGQLAGMKILQEGSKAADQRSKE
jgi:hypothetical protein